MINQSSLKKASNIARAIAHPVRLSILKFISEQGTTNVNSIYNTLKLEQSITSQHLRILRIADLVNTEREGKFIHYSINYTKIASINKALTEFFGKKSLMIEEEEHKVISSNGVRTQYQSQAKAS